MISETGSALLRRANETAALMARRTNPLDEETMAEGIEKYWTLEEVAHVTGYSLRSIRRFVAEGEIEAERWGREYRVTSPALRAFIEARRQAPVPEGPRGRRGPDGDEEPGSGA
jgi:excisionase family DNA binding protein